MCWHAGEGRGKPCATSCKEYVFLVKKRPLDQAPEQAVSLQVQQDSYWPVFRWTCLQNPDILLFFPDTCVHAVPDGAFSPEVLQQCYGEANQKAQGVYFSGLSRCPDFAILSQTTAVLYSSLSFMPSKRRSTLERNHNPQEPSPFLFQPSATINDYYITQREHFSGSYYQRKHTKLIEKLKPFSLLDNISNLCPKAFTEI